MSLGSAAAGILLREEAVAAVTRHQAVPGQ